MNTTLISPDSQSPILANLERLVTEREGFAKPTTLTLDRAGRAVAGLTLFVLTNDTADHTFDVIRRFRAEGAECIFVVGPATAPKLILRAIQAGADLYLDEAELETEFDLAIARLHGHRPEPRRKGQVLAVMSAAGGCGASTIAVNLAVLLARAHGRCNLIDLNLGKSDLAPLLDLKPSYTLADLSRNEDRLDSSLYEKLLTTHSTGVNLLAAPRGYDDIRAIPADAVDRALVLAQETFTDVVVDLEDSFHEDQLVALRHATRILLVCRLDFTAVRNARRILDHLAAQGIPADRVELIANQVGLPSELACDEAEAALGVPLTRFIPHDPKNVGWANNTGIPAAVGAPDTAVVQAIAGLVGLEKPVATEPGSVARVIAWAGLNVSRAVLRVRAAVRRPAPSTPTPPATNAGQELNTDGTIPAPQQQSGGATDYASQRDGASTRTADQWDGAPTRAAGQRGGTSAPTACPV